MMRSAARSIAWIAVAWVAVGFPGQGSAQPAPQTESVCAACCYHPQSPRSLTATDWNQTSRIPTVSQISANSIRYKPRADVSLTLNVCSQHYHCGIENVQACPRQSAAPAVRGSACPAKLTVGSWVEIHTAYYDGPVLNHPPRSLDECKKSRTVVVVTGYHAMVTEDPTGSPVPLHFGPPAAEWWGSATNADNPPPPAPPECKVAAFWSFALGCDFKVSLRQLEPLNPPDGTRVLQPSNRLSRDLTHIIAPSKHP
jgi:hypothetical protein